MFYQINKQLLDELFSQTIELKKNMLISKSDGHPVCASNRKNLILIVIVKYESAVHGYQV